MRCDAVHLDATHPDTYVQLAITSIAGFVAWILFLLFLSRFSFFLAPFMEQEIEQKKSFTLHKNKKKHRQIQSCSIRNREEDEHAYVTGE